MEILTKFIKNTKTETYVIFIDVEEHEYGKFTEIRKNVFTYSVPKLLHKICDLSCGIKKLVDVKGRVVSYDNGMLHIRAAKKAKGKARPKTYDSDSESDYEDIANIDVKHIINSLKLEIVKIGEGIFKRRSRRLLESGS